MPGILTQLPDLTAILNNRGELVARLRGVADPLPFDPASLTANLAGGLHALGNAVPSDPQTLVAPLQTAMASLQELFPNAQLGGLQELSNGLSQALGIIAPAREILASGNGLRDLREIVFEQAGDPNVLINGLLAQLTTLIPADAVKVLQTFVSTLRDFESSIPTDPAAIAHFLAQSFLGMPVNLLAEPLGVVKSFYSEIDALVDSASLETLHRDIQAAANQLASSHTLIKNLNLADAAGYKAVADGLKAAQAESGRVHSRLGSLASGFQGRLAGLDLNAFSNRLENTLHELPEIKVAQIDDFVNLVTEPLRQLNRKIESVSPAQLAQALEGGRNFFAAMIADQGYEELRETLLKPFKQVGSAIDGLNLEQVRAAIAGVLSHIRDGINQVAAAMDRFKEDVKGVIDRIGNVLDTVNVAGAEVESAVNALVPQIQNALQALPLADFGNQVENVAIELGRLLTDFANGMNPAMETLNAFRDELEKIDIRQAAEPAFDAMQAVKAVLEKLNLSLVAGDQAAALRTRLDALVDIDLAPVRQTLMTAYDEAVPRAALRELAVKYQALTGKMSEYSPGTLLDPLLPPFARLNESLSQFDPAALLEPVIPQLEAAKARLNSISPAQLIAPLAKSFAELMTAMNALAPSRLLAPLAEVFQDLMALFEKLDIAPLLDELEDLFAEWLEKCLSGLQGAAGNFSGAGELRSYLDGISGTSGQPEFGYMPGDLLKPVQDLFEKIISLLDQVPEDKLLAAFQSLRTQFTGALQTLEPARLAVDLSNRLQERMSSFDFLNNFAVLGSLHAPYSNIVLEFDTIDPVRVPAEFRARYNELAGLIAALNPAQVFASLRSQYRGLNGSLITLAGRFNSAGLTPVFGPVKGRLDSLIPAFLHGDLALDEIRAQLQQLNPKRLADELNQEFETFLVRLTKFGDTLVSELPKLATAFKGGTASFVPELLKDAFGSVYGPLKSQLQALDPAVIIAELESAVFAPAKAALEALNPGTILSNLGIDDRFDEFRTTLDVLVNGLRSVQTISSLAWAELLSNLDQFDPELLKKHVDAAFVPVQQFINNLDLVRTLEAFDQALTRIGNDLERVLQDAEAALHEMALAIPG